MIIHLDHKDIRLGHANLWFRIKSRVIDTLSILYNKIAVHLNYYTITLDLLHKNLLFCIKSDVIDTVSIL